MRRRSGRALPGGMHARRAEGLLLERATGCQPARNSDTVGSTVPGGRCAPVKFFCSPWPALSPPTDCFKLSPRSGRLLARCFGESLRFNDLPPSVGVVPSLADAEHPMIFETLDTRS